MISLLIFYAALALCVSFLCSLLEASLLSLPRSAVESMVAQGSRVGEQMRALKENVDRPLIAILTLNTVAHTVGAAGVGAQAALIFGDTAVGIASGLMTLAILVLSEIIPKTIGAAHATSLAGVTTWTTRAMIFISYPLIVPLEQLNRWIAYKGHHGHISRMEVLATIRMGFQGGILAQREHRVINNLMSLAEVSVLDIHTPRTVMFSLPAAATVGETLNDHPALRFSRIPVRDQTPDDVLGYVTRNDLREAAAEGRRDATLAQLKRPILTVPEQASVADVLEQLLARSEHIALVVDEHGGVEGLVTLEDVLETLLGQEIVDETDPAPDMRELARRRAQQRASSR